MSGKQQWNYSVSRNKEQRMEIKELLIALIGEGLDGDELIGVLNQKLADGEITQEDYDWAIAQLQEEKDKKEAFELLGV